MNNPTRRRPPAGIAIAAVIVALETLLLLAVGVGYAVYAVLDTAQDATPVVVLALFAIFLAAGLGACAWGLWGGRRWARSIAITWQLLQAAAATVVWPASPAMAIALWVAAGVVVVVVVGATRRDMREGIEP